MTTIFSSSLLLRDFLVFYIPSPNTAKPGLNSKFSLVPATAENSGRSLTKEGEKAGDVFFVATISI